MALFVIGVRMKAANRPTSLRKIIIPPLGMSTGFLMFLVPFTRIPLGAALAAFAVGLVLAFPLIRTSKFEFVNGEVYLKRSRAFIFVLLGLLALRLLLHPLVEEYVTLQQSAGIFFVLAFGMILHWRVAMLLQYRRFARKTGVDTEETQ